VTELHGVPPARIVVAHPSAFVRKTLRRLFVETDDIEVVGEARDGGETLAQVAAVSPDGVALGLALPGVGGVELVRRLRESRPRLALLLLASEDESGALFESLNQGAFDFVDLSRCSPMDLGSLGPELVAKLRWSMRRTAGRPATEDRVQAARGSAALPNETAIVCIGASTGGPPAIQRILEDLGGDFPIPIAVVQHMPAAFLPAFAERLSHAGPLQVKLAEEADALRKGRVLVAPGGRHLVLARTSAGCVAHLAADADASAHVPSVDALFESSARCFGRSSVGVILTGMGTDGRRGAGALAATGGFVVAQSERSCTVYGMPKAVVEAGLASAVWPLDEIASKLAAFRPGAAPR
jgi:two-component system, chemotaxis family, protein-glutamate methylesterase/glutaminase